jgi:hypothetical protein
MALKRKHPFHTYPKNGVAYVLYYGGDGKEHVSCSKFQQIIVDRNGGKCVLYT